MKPLPRRPWATTLASTELTLKVDNAATEANEATHVNLALVAPDDVGANSEVTVTFTLTGALFGTDGADQRLQVQ